VRNTRFHKGDGLQRGGFSLPNPRDPPLIMPLSLIRSKKKDGLKKAAALLKRDNNNSYPPEGGNNHHNNVSSPSSPSSHEIINLTSEAGLMVNKARSKGPRLGLGGMSNSLLFEEDPGIMSEAETSSTGFLPPYGSNGGGNRRSAKFKTSLAGLGPMYPRNQKMTRVSCLKRKPPLQHVSREVIAAVTPFPWDPSHSSEAAF
ncbi:Uncharacterized protein FKW44_011100, partial [Caligus rogercresseyi]